MAITLNRPFTGTFLNKATNTTLSDSGTVPDIIRDEVSQRNKTPRKLWRPPTPYTRYVREGYCDTTELALRLESSNSLAIRSGAHSYSGFYTSVPPPFPQYLVDRAVSKCLDKLKNDHVNLGQAFAERKQTDELIGGNARRIAENIESGWAGRLKALEKDLRRARGPRQIRIILNLISAARLEIAYGWIPLMQDSFGAVQHLSEREKEANRAIITVKARAKETSFESSSVGWGYRSYSGLVDRHREIEHQVLVRLDYYKDNGLLHELAQLGITNPASLAWELTPFSFVVDWFFPIGDYLNRLDATLGLSFKGGSASKKTTVKVKPTNGRCTNTGLSTSIVIPSGKGRMMLFNRNVYGSSPMVPPPSFKPGGNLSHVYNGAALIAQALSRHGFLG